MPRRTATRGQTAGRAIVRPDTPAEGLAFDAAPGSDLTGMPAETGESIGLAIPENRPASAKQDR
jgi:hypothetical protein